MTPKKIAQILRCCADFKKSCPKTCPLYDEGKCVDIAISKALDVLDDYGDGIGTMSVINLLADRVEKAVDEADK